MWNTGKIAITVIVLRVYVCVDVKRIIIIIIVIVIVIIIIVVIVFFRPPAPAQSL